MANQEQLRILTKEGVEAWNKWREDNPGVEIDIVEADLSFTPLQGANLRNSNLRDSNFLGADLRDADLRDANLRDANFCRAILFKADLRDANLGSADLRKAIFLEADIRNAYLSSVQALETDFTNATFTGACIKDWNINSETNLNNVICDYIYLQRNRNYQKQKTYEFSERRPADPNRNFEPGEFAKLVQKSVETVDLIFNNGIDWKAFLSSYQDVQVEYGEDNISIQAIEKKQDGAFVIRLNAPSEADKGEIESKIKQSYETQLKVLKADNHRLLQHNASLENIVNTLASRPIIVEAKAVAENQSKNVEVEMNVTGGQVSGMAGKVSGDINIHAPEQKQTLAKAAEEIQELLKQLEQTYPSNTTTEQMVVATKAIEQIENNPSFKQRVINAAKEAGLAAFEKALDSTPGAFITGAVRGWIEAEA